MANSLKFSFPTNMKFLQAQYISFKPEHHLVCKCEMAINEQISRHKKIKFQKIYVVNIIVV